MIVTPSVSMEIGFSSDVTTSMPMTLLAGVEDSLLFSFEVVSGVGGRSAIIHL